MKISSRLILLALFLILLVTVSGSGCNDNEDDSGNATLSGVVAGVNFAEGTVELIAENGTVIGRSGAIDLDGAYSITFDGPAVCKDKYMVLNATKDGKSLRSIVMGYASGGNYEGGDTYITVDTETAVLLCTIGNHISLYDYGLFMQGTVDGVYDETSPTSLYFPYREVHDVTSSDVKSYVDGTSLSLPTAAEITDLIEAKNHDLTSSIAVTPAEDCGLPFTRRAFTSPDGKARVIVSYDSENSTLTDSTPVTVAATTGNSDGSFEWNVYVTNVHGNQLDTDSVRVLAVDQSNSTNATTTLYDPYALNEGTGSVSDDLTGSFEVVSSNAPGLIDYNATGLSPAADNVNAQFVYTFTNPVNSSNIIFRLIFKDVNSRKIVEQTAYAVSGPLKTFTSDSFSLTSAAHQDKLVVCKCIVNNRVLAQVEDMVDKTRYLSTPPIPFYKTLAETRVTDTTVLTNNIRTSHDDVVQPRDSGNVYSHYILDFDKFLKNNSIDAWKGKTYSNNIPDDGKRTPLLLIHGWEGDEDYRSAAKLNDWAQNPVNYMFKLLSYYMSEADLYSKYHIYIAHWPSYKHLTFNGLKLKEILDDVKANHPDTDLGRGMNDPDVGVVVMTHSTGGLIFRSMAQEHKAFKGSGSSAGDYDHLRKAIILAAPHHGTPGAVNTWPNSLSWLVHKDLETQSTSDLEWDSYDGYSNIRFILLHWFSYKDDRISNRYVEKCLNVKEFDTDYLNEIGWAKTYNPWLMWLNKNFPTATGEGSLSSKCILYSGWTIILGNAGNFIDNYYTLNVSARIFNNMGYNNDSVLPLSSTLLAVDTSNPGFTLERKQESNYIKTEWYQNSKFYGYKDYNIIVIGAARDHPLNMQFRILWDYDHDMMVNGCLNNGSPAQIGNLIDADITTASGFTDDIDTDVRPYYTRGAWNYSHDQDITISNATTFKNVLKADSLYLLMRRDLLDAAP